MKLTNINSANSFGAIILPPIADVPPAIIRECSQAGWLATGKNAINILRREGIVLVKSKKFVDVYDGDSVSSLCTLSRPTSPKKIQDFVDLVQEIRKEVAEYTDSKIRLIKGKKVKLPITTSNLKTAGRTDIDKSALIKSNKQHS